MEATDTTVTPTPDLTPDAALGRLLGFPHPIEVSTWISAIRYRRTPDGSRFLALFLRRTEPGDEPVALLYAGDSLSLPSWLPGLLSAGIVSGRDEASGSLKRSVGRAYNRLLKGRSDIRYQRIEGRERVAELRRMMEVGR
jgi:hypothetical protein